MNNHDSDRKAKLSKNKLSIEYSREEIESLLPNLAEELSLEQNDSLEEPYQAPEIHPRTRDDIQNAVKSHYNTESELFSPKTTDFLRRCSTIEEADEIIDYQLKISEITLEEANKLRDLCKKHGVRYFGEKKEWGYYEKTYRT